MCGYHCLYNVLHITSIIIIIIIIMKGTKVQTLGARAIAGALVAWAIIIMAMGAIINTHAHR